jgi:hypothetical protein
MSAYTKKIELIQYPADKGEVRNHVLERPATHDGFRKKRKEQHNQDADHACQLEAEADGHQKALNIVHTSARKHPPFPPLTRLVAQNKSIQNKMKYSPAGALSVPKSDKRQIGLSDEEALTSGCTRKPQKDRNTKLETHVTSSAVTLLARKAAVVEKEAKYSRWKLAGQDIVVSASAKTT